jgi:signal peptidase I
VVIDHSEPESPRERSATHSNVHASASHPVAWIKETLVIVVGAVVLSLIIKTFLAQAFFIPSASMENTLEVGDRVLVTKLAPGPFDVHRGDIVVFKDPGGWLSRPISAPSNPVSDTFRSAMTGIGLLPQDSGEHLIKRIIGLPGDHVACCDDSRRVTVNGVGISEPYLRPDSLLRQVPFTVTVPAGRLWVMGDNRQHSGDSRFHMSNPGDGTIPLANVVGVAFLRVWPADRIGLLRNPGATFVGVPGPTP